MGENGTAIPTEGNSCTDLKQEQLKLYYKDVRMKQIIYHDLSNFRNGQKCLKENLALMRFKTIATLTLQYQFNGCVV